MKRYLPQAAEAVFGSEQQNGHREGTERPIRRRAPQRNRWVERLAPLGDLILTAAVLAGWSLPRTTTVAFISAAMAASLLTRTDVSIVCAAPAEKAVRAAGRIGGLMLIALPVAWVDGVTGPAALTAVVVSVLLFGYRYVLERVADSKPDTPRRVAIVGTGPLGLEIGEHLLERSDTRIQPVGFIDRSVRGEVPLPVLGEPGELDRIVSDHQLDSVIVAFGGFSEGDLVPVLRRCEELPIEVVVLPRFFELSVGDVRSELWGYPVARLHGPAELRSAWRMKRLVDIVGSGSLLLLFAPVMLVVAAAVKLSSKGPVLFKQERVGYRGRVFQMYKFRSMVENDDGDITWSVEFDHRVTPVGRVLRVTHLDELPQLVNVLRGDMSLVGPRPERPHFVKLFSDKFDNYEDRHRVPVGITGWSQVNGLWGDTSLEARSRLDNRYIESWSLSRDLLILVKTIPTIFKGRS